MILLYLLIGTLTSIIGALPLGASNIVVINTSIKQNLRQAMKIAFAAGVAEVMLSYYALNYNMLIKNFFNSNQWLQVVIAIILLSIGSFLFFRKTKEKKAYNRNNIFLKSKYSKGFFLGLLNPPVLVYWLLVYGIINSNVAILSVKSSVTVLLLFFVGVYIGKVLTLYIYGKFSIYMQQKFQNINLMINKITGSLLFAVGILQFVKLYFI